MNWKSCPCIINSLVRVKFLRVRNCPTDAPQMPFLLGLLGITLLSTVGETNCVIPVAMIVTRRNMVLRNKLFTSCIVNYFLFPDQFYENTGIVRPMLHNCTVFLQNGTLHRHTRMLSMFKVNNELHVMYCQKSVLYCLTDLNLQSISQIICRRVGYRPIQLG